MLVLLQEGYLVVRDKMEDSDDGELDEESHYLSLRTNVWPSEETIPG